jgi:signal peptidase complex subunit 1
LQDFEGQRLAELLTNFMLGAAGVCFLLRNCPANAYQSKIIAFFVGFMAQDIQLSLYIGLAGTVLTFLVVVPPWPFYNKNPEPWLPPHSVTSGVNIQVDGQKIG